MWAQQKEMQRRWGKWEWFTGLEIEKVLAARAAVGRSFKDFLVSVRRKGEETMVVDGITTPFGFTPNDFVRGVVAGVLPGVKVDIFNLRLFFQTIRLAPGTWLEGPDEAQAKTYRNVLAGRG